MDALFANGGDSFDVISFDGNSSRIGEKCMPIVKQNIDLEIISQNDQKCCVINIVIFLIIC